MNARERAALTIPEFVTLPQTAVSGRLIRVGGPGTGDPTVPVVLEAHLLPSLVGSSIYVLGAVGPSDTSWPYFPVGGAVVTGPEAMTVLEMDDDVAYSFTPGKTFAWDDEAFDFAPVETAEDLIDRVLVFGADALHLHPWDAAAVAGVLEECQGYDHFDEFMALSEAELPS